MRVIFLDVDGVLNNRYSMSLGGGLYNVDPRCVEALNKICTEANAVCVLSSTWRLGWPILAFQQFMEENGFTGKVVDKTPVMRDEERGAEIAAYITQCNEHGYPIESWVILDDDSDMGPLLPFLVQTDHEKGLMEWQADKAIEILNQ